MNDEFVRDPQSGDDEAKSSEPKALPEDSETGAAEDTYASQTTSEFPMFNDDFIIGKGFPVGGEPELPEAADTEMPPKGKKKKRKKTGCFGAFAWVFVVIVISLGIAVGLIMGLSDMLGVGKDSICQVEIKQGMTMEQVAAELKEAGAIRYPALFRLYTKLKHYNDYKYGVYEFNSDIGYGGILDKLQTEGAQAETVEVRIPEMANIDDIAVLLEEAGVCSKSDFITTVRNGNFKESFVKDIPVERVYYRLEGYLFPDTYKFYKDDTGKGAVQAIEKMLKNMDSKFTEADRKRASEITAGGMQMNMHSILTLASIIEMEASSHPEEMANVAAVFYNRLEWDEPKLLGSTPTAKYPHGEKYDTNKYEGLPPGPLCAPSLNAIQAALNPTPDFSYTYFVTDKDMKFYYNKSLAEHNATIKTLKAQGKWLG